ncbi:MAG: protein translocase subunit SecD [Chitinophagaceae bacterium]|nr:protein translocase subunit SecD [Chitinophagaceae bacterium]
MKLKGLVWFFTIALIIISLWELSYTWVVRNYESSVKAKAEKIVRTAFPDLKGDERTAAVEFRKKRILDSTSDKSIYPIFGTTYRQCKANELNLGLDLQGGISVTMDVNLSDLVRSLSNNGKDPQLLNALRTATAQKGTSDADFITLFTKEYIRNNGEGKLSAMFAGPGKEIKIGDNDAAVTTKLKTIASGAIKETYKVLVRRIDKFGVAQPNINFDENKGIINVELAGVTDVERVQKLLQASAHLQFWEVYRPDEIGNSLKIADENLQNYLNGVTDSVKADSTKMLQNANPLFNLIKIQNPMPDRIGYIALQDTGIFYEYINNEVVKNALPADCKFLLGVEEKGLKDTKNAQRLLPLYAIKTQTGTEKAPLEGEGVAEAYQGFDDKGRPSIKMEMTSTGSKTWARLTTKNVDRPIAIALDDIVYSAPNVTGPIEGGSSEISGNFSVQEAQDLSNILKSGRLDAPAKIVAQQVVGPTLGKEAVKGGAMSFGIAFLVIFILMLVYYNTGGWVANIALILNLLFTIGVLTAMGFTLTAAGIAGLVLTIGLAVDTNVIIFERIKEEIEKGKSYQLAVNDGYRRSLAPVIDAHVTSLLTAVILFYFGLGPVLGFATTQIIGILLSLFCGILVSRLITDFWTNKNRHFNYFTAISRKIFKHASYKFIEFRKYAYMISVLVLIAGIASYFNGFHLGVEFKGGRSYTVQFDRAVRPDDVRDDLKAALEGDNPTIKTVNDSRHLNITTAYLKEMNNADSAVISRLYQGLKKVLPANITSGQFAKNNIQGYSAVQPSISEDLKRGAVKATIFAILIIFLYIFIRFRDWRYSMGTIFTLLHDVFITLAVFSFFKNIVPFPLEIDQHFIAAVLTVIGFSMNDTVIVFDRIREYSRDMKGATKTTIINRAINDTLSRTIMTSLTVFLTLLILFIFGGEVTRGFAFAMLIGVITGTYSSIFVGAPVLVDFAKNKPLGAADAVEEKKK